MTYYDLRCHVLRAGFVLVNGVLVLASITFAVICLADGFLQSIP